MRLLSGLRAWTVQRISAALLLGFVLWFVAHLIAAPPQGYEEWRALVGRPGVGIALGLFFAALLLHAWVGVRDILLDYVHSRALRAALLVAVAVGLYATGTGLALALAALHFR
jgi:succinate dehydrogenase / fumarate reductase membrane anchor subunit